jgi:hypothetical protein
VKKPKLRCSALRANGDGLKRRFRVTNADNDVTNGTGLLRSVAPRLRKREDVLMPVLHLPALRLVATWVAVAVFFRAENVLVGAARHRPCHPPG